VIDLHALSGENLRREAKRADRALADEIVRVRATDIRFGAVLDYSLAVEAEQERRKNRQFGPDKQDGEKS